MCFLIVMNAASMVLYPAHVCSAEEHVCSAEEHVQNGITNHPPTPQRSPSFWLNLLSDCDEC